MRIERDNGARLVLLSALPMAGAILGAWFDERTKLGFSTWRSACRAAGFDFASMLSFTWQLLPWAWVGLLSGGAALLLYGAAQRQCCARHCLAAHAGCVLSLPLGLILCASSLPLGATLLAEVAVAALLAALLLRTSSQFAGAHP